MTAPGTADTLNSVSTPFAVGAAVRLLQGRYQLHERLGEGGMGVVWRCFDHELEEWVAIKFLREDLARDEALRGLFRREVRLARRVTHPNVARVNEFGREGELYFLTMEFIAGESLQRQLEREGSLAPGRVYARAVGLCKGLAAAHAVGVVHGDLKPANVLLTPGRGAVLTDFGIARALAESPTQGDVGRGTPVYMAPEQIAGQPMTPQSDVYATGVLLFEALTGMLPWLGTDVLTLLAEKASGQPLELARFAPDLPPGWCELLTVCMHDDPGQRPRDGRALLARLGALGAGPEEPARSFAAAEEPAPRPAEGTPHWLLGAAFTGDDAEARLGWMTGDRVDALTQVQSPAAARAMAPTGERDVGEQPTIARPRGPGEEPGSRG